MIERSSECQIQLRHEIDKRTKHHDARHNNRNSLLLTPLTKGKYSDFGATDTAESIQFPDNPYVCEQKFFRLEPQRLDRPDQTFQFKCFDIGAQTNRSDSFMGSFLHVQEEQKNPFDINVKIPSLREHVAFSNIGSLAKSQFLSSFELTDRKPIPTESIQQATVQSRFLDQLKQSKAQSQRRRDVLSVQEDSIFLDLEPIMNYQPPERTMSRMWETSQRQIPVLDNSGVNSSKLIYPSIQNLQLSVYESRNQFFFQPERTQLSQCALIQHLCKVVQGIQTQFFKIDYAMMRWSAIPGMNLRLRDYFGLSAANYVQGVLTAAGYRSQLEVALEYLKVKEPSSKFIYSQVSAVLKECLLCLESIVVECLEEEDLTFLEFQLRTRRLMVELKLLKGFILREGINKPYYEFDKTFVHTEKELFFMVYTRMQLNDYSREQQWQLIKRLTLGSFKCILSSLNVRLHHSRREWQQLFYQQYYFGLFFEQRRDLIEKLSDRLNLVHLEDYEVYTICRQKRPIELSTSYSQLVIYERQWSQLFKNKKRAIKGIEERMLTERRRHNEEVYERRAKQIIEMKMKLAQRLENELKQKSQNQKKQREYIKRLQDEIQRKQEEQRLTKLIEIEREKGFLLDNQLKEKRTLLTHKHSLLAEHPEFASHFRQQEKKPDADSQTLSLQKVQSIQSNPDKMQEERSNPSMMAIETSELPTSQQISQVTESQAIRIYPSPPQVPTEKIQQKLQQQVDEPQPSVEAEVPLKTVLQVCVNQVILGQLSVVNLAMSSLIFTKYRIADIFSFMRNYFLSAKGHLMCQLIEQAVDNHSNFKLSHLKDWFYLEQSIAPLKPTFYLSGDVGAKGMELTGEVNLLQQSLEMKVGFEFRALPDILKPYFGYLHLVKYMEILAFMMKLQQCVRLVDIQWKTLNQCQRHLDSQRFDKFYEGKLIKKLHFLRYLVQACLIRLQNYLFYHVIEQQYCKLQAHVSSHEFESLPDKHLHFLDRVILRGFISNQQLNISNRLKSLLASVRHLHQIVMMFCLDDIATYIRPEIEKKLQEIQTRFSDFSSILEHIMGDK